MCMFTFYLEMTMRNASVVVMVAFRAHAIKDITRTQLAGAVKLYAAPGERKELLKLDKKDMIPEVAQMFQREGIVSVQGDAKEFSCDNIIKTGIF